MAQPIYQERPPERGWREQDLLDLPENGNRYEIIDGSLHVTPPAEDDHHELADNIRTTLWLAAPAGWRVIREIGLRLPSGNLIPDLTVLRPGSPRGLRWHQPEDVALVVEVESPASRRHDRFTKPAMYAEVGIPAYWRVERGNTGPVMNCYELVEGDHYKLMRTVGPENAARLPEPFPVTLDPAAWLR